MCIRRQVRRNKEKNNREKEKKERKRKEVKSDNGISEQIVEHSKIQEQNNPVFAVANGNVPMHSECFIIQTDTRTQRDVSKQANEFEIFPLIMPSKAEG